MSMPGAWSYVPLGNRDWVFYANGKTVFSHPNALGSSVMQTDNTGAVVQDMLYYPWGQVWQWPQTGSGYHFAGLMYDTYDDKHVAPFRLLSPNLGRWLSPDPLGGDVTNPQSLNRYAYVLNNPTNLVDPMGLLGSCPYGQTNNVCNPPPPINPCAMLPPASYSGPPSCAPIEPSYPTGPTNTGSGTLNFPDNPLTLRIVQVAFVCGGTIQIDYALKIQGTDPDPTQWTDPGKLGHNYYISEHVFKSVNSNPYEDPDLAQGGIIRDMSTNPYPNGFVDRPTGLGLGPPNTTQFFSVSLDPNPNSPGMMVPIVGAPGGVNQIQAGPGQPILVNGQGCHN